MVAAKAEHFRASTDNQISMRLNRTKHPLRVMRVKIAITKINHCKMIKRVKPKGEMRQLGKLC